MIISRYQPACHTPIRPSAQEEAPAQEEDGFSLKSAVATGFCAMLGRRIPTMVPEISDERREKILSEIQPGDIILETNCAYPGLARLEFWTVRSNYTHAAIYEGDGKFLEATTPGGVRRTDLRQYLHGPVKIAVLRPPYQTPEDKEAALAFCRSHLGKSYDSSFDYGNENEFYCSELVDKALQSMPHPIKVETCAAAGKQAVSPDAFLDIPNAQLVHDDKSDYWLNKAGHWPLAVAAAGAGWAGYALAGGGGAAVGGVVGLIGSILTLNYLQTGHILPSVPELIQARRDARAKKALKAEA